MFRKKIRRWTAAILAVALLLLMGAAPALAETFSAIVTAKTMTVYGEASLTEKLGTLGKDAVVRVTGFSSTIAKFSYQGKTGYAKVSDLKRVEDVALKALTNAAAPVYQGPDDVGVSKTVPAGTRLYVLSLAGDWARVESNGAVGYVQVSYLDKADDNWSTGAADPAAPAVTPSTTDENGITVRTYFAVTIENMKVYKSASTGAKSLGTLKPGIQVTVLATSSNGWAYIELNGKHGYARTKSLREGVAEDYTPAPTVAPSASAAPGTPGVVSAASLPVFSKADTESALLGTLKQGQAVNVVKWNSTWAYIELNGHYGYCAVSGLSRADAEATPAPTYVPPSTVGAKVGTVTVKTLPVYQTASTAGVKLGSLKKGQRVNVIQTSGGWAYIELNGNYGFCAASGLSVAKEDEEGLPAGYTKADFTATVVTGDARAYAATTADAENVALKRGAEVQVAGYNSTWACITQDGKYAFVPIKVLSKASYAPIDGDGSDLQTLLKALLAGGYYDGIPGTSYNAAAIAAIKRFQSACGMEQTGVADQNMLRIVYSGYAPVSSLLYTSLSKGDKGDSVSRVQSRLFALGYLSRTASLDGEFGATTVNAVKLFQQASGITASGTADTTTLKALYNPEARKLPSGTKAADYAKLPAATSTYIYEMPEALASNVSTYSSGMSAAQKLEYVIYEAQGKMGCPYVYGATGPSKFDCSGLTVWAFDKVGVHLKRSAYNQGYDETYPKIEGWQNLRRGDIVFFNTISDSDLSDHAGIYLGDGFFMHASSGAHKVVVSNLTTGFYSRVFSWGRRILK